MQKDKLELGGGGGGGGGAKLCAGGDIVFDGIVFEL